MVFGYTRFSTIAQHESLQLDALNAAGCDRLMIDRALGDTTERPVLAEMLNRLRHGDTVMVWRLDRLGRSLRHLIDVVADLQLRGVTLVSLTELAHPSRVHPYPSTRRSACLAPTVRPQGASVSQA